MHSDFFTATKGGLVVSCQALPEEPLHSSEIMARMAKAAEMGGAVGIRANSVKDIREIKKVVNLPVIGIIKRVFETSEVYITPTITEIDALCDANADVIALDATDRVRPDGERISEFFTRVRKLYPNKVFMADCATYEDAERAYNLGFDCVGTTLRGYTDETRGIKIPDFELLEKLADSIRIPIIAEGGISTPEELARVLSIKNIHCAVVGGAITRPQLICKKFTDAIKKS